MKQTRARAGQSPSIKRDGTQLDLVGKLFTSGTLSSTIEHSARKRETREMGRKDG